MLRIMYIWSNTSIWSAKALAGTRNEQIPVQYQSCNRCHRAYNRSNSLHRLVWLFLITTNLWQLRRERGSNQSTQTNQLRNTRIIGLLSFFLHTLLIRNARSFVGILTVIRPGIFTLTKKGKILNLKLYTFQLYDWSPIQKKGIHRWKCNEGSGIHHKEIGTISLIKKQQWLQFV